MALLSENAGILPYYVYGKSTNTPFQSNMQTPKVYAVSNDFSFNFGARVPSLSECEIISMPYVVAEKRTFYLDLGKLKKKEGYDTVLLLDASIVSASIYLNGDVISHLKDLLMGALVRIDPYLSTSNHMFISVEHTKSNREEILHSVKTLYLKKSRITDIFPRTSITGQRVEILCDVRLESGDVKAALGGNLKVTLLDNDERVVTSSTVPISAFKRNYWKTVRAVLSVNEPHLWNIDDPYRYTIQVEFFSFDETLIDMKEIPYGIRQWRLSRYSPKIASSPALLLNGQPVKIKGIVLRNQDEHLPSKLKKIGINAVRVINPYNQAFFEACDREGILVMCEVDFNVSYPKRSFFSHNKKEVDPLDIPFALIGEMILRLKNYASVFCWSAGVRKLFGNTVLGEFIRSIDDTRALNSQGDSNFSLSDFYSADDCELSQLKSIESYSLFYEGNILGIYHNPRIYRQYPFILCDVDITQPTIGEKLQVFERNKRFLGLFLSVPGEEDPISALQEIL